MGTGELLMVPFTASRFLKDFQLSYGHIKFMVWSGIDFKRKKGVRSKLNLSLVTYYICLKATYALETI